MQEVFEDCGEVRNSCHRSGGFISRPAKNPQSNGEQFALHSPNVASGVKGL
jgi:hypothetical protein